MQAANPGLPPDPPLTSRRGYPQLLTALVENLPEGGEAWVLDETRKKGPGLALAEMVSLVEGVLITR